MKKNKTITLTPVQIGILDFLTDSAPNTVISLKEGDESMKHLVLNHEESIVEHLTSSPIHMAVIKNAIDKDLENYQSYFNGKMYLDDELVDQPFLAFVANHVFKWCGCAVGIDGRLEGLYQIMKAVDEKHTEVISYEKFQAKVKNEFGGDNLFCILMDSFDSLNLFEHGGSVNSSWLSQDGMVVYKHLQEWMKTRKV